MRHLTEAQKAQQAKQAKIKREFLEWKRTLKDMINIESRVELMEDGCYIFLLPPALVKLVWEVMVKEEAARQRIENPEDAQQRAIDRLKADLQLQSDRVLAQQHAHAIREVIKPDNPTVKATVERIIIEHETAKRIPLERDDPTDGSSSRSAGQHENNETPSRDDC